MSIWEYERRQKPKRKRRWPAWLVVGLFTVAVFAPIVITIWTHL